MWEERYATDEYVYGTEPNEFLKANADQLKAGSVLCLGDGRRTQRRLSGCSRT